MDACNMFVLKQLRQHFSLLPQNSNTQKLPKSASENCLPTLSRIST